MCFPANTSLFRVTIETIEKGVNYVQINKCLTSSSVSIDNFEQVNATWFILSFKPPYITFNLCTDLPLLILNPYCSEITC